MKGYKAFKKGLICQGKQYSENTIFEEENAEICKCGMHFCENPLDVLDYYPLIDGNCDFTEFVEVEALDEVLTDDNKKFCTKKLKIGAKLSIAGLVKAAIDFIFEKSEIDDNNSAQLASSGNYAQLASSGNYAKLASSGNSAQLASSGENSIVAGIGIDNIAKGAKGNWLVLAEWVYSDKKNCYIPKCVKSKKIDGEKIKENTFYRLVDGKFVEVKE